jgi:hypothetical protein
MKSGSSTHSTPSHISPTPRSVTWSFIYSFQNKILPAFIISLHACLHLTCTQQILQFLGGDDTDFQIVLGDVHLRLH